jgi:phosphatidate cytidylyltransferase
MAMNDLPKRAATAVVFVVVMVGGIVWNFYSFELLTGLILLGCLWEYYGLISAVQAYPENKKMQWRGVYLLLGLSIFYLFLPENNRPLGVALFPSLSLIFVLELFVGGKRNIQNAALNLLGIIYIVIPIGLLHYIVRLGDEPWFPNRSGIVLGMLLLVWTNDTMAYFTGRMLGKHKLFPSISPGKTWEGFIGGVVFSIVAAFLLSKYFINYSLTDWIIIALIMSVIGTLGDLFESMIKRNLGVKDSGSLMPGHGGLLDRFDAFIFSIPFVFAYIMFTHS